MKLLSDISEIIEWYHSNYRGATIDQIVNADAKLRILLYRLSEMVAEYSGDYLAAYRTRKLEQARTLKKLTNEGMGVTKAEQEAVIEVSELADSESEYEATKVRLKLLLDQGNKIADHFSQRISILKKEQETTKRD